MVSVRAQQWFETRTLEEVLENESRLLEHIRTLENRVVKGEERRRALIHIMGDMKELNQRLADQRKAMLHIMIDYEKDRRRLARQSERQDNSRRAVLHILKDSHQSNLRLERTRKAMIHIMDDLRKTTDEMLRREQELRDKQEQLVQAGKLATLGELTTGVAHELNNPLNNIGLFIGNAIDWVELGQGDSQRILGELRHALDQVQKASEIISHLRVFGRAATFTFEPIAIKPIIQRALSLMNEQLRLRQIEVLLNLCAEEPMVMGNPIQLEQVFLNLLTNARDAVMDSDEKALTISCRIKDEKAEISFSDSGHGIPEGLEQRIFDPFFTTKDVGKGTGLGLSITYAIISDHLGTIRVGKAARGLGAVFVIQLPLAKDDSSGGAWS
ncbi:MAG TPA: ATP-binding protein [Blastocatellia bacterium]|nr:ATP-binding protein [Blastocatellia bacterium]